MHMKIQPAQRNFTQQFLPYIVLIISSFSENIIWTFLSSIFCNFKVTETFIITNVAINKLVKNQIIIS